MQQVDENTAIIKKIRVHPNFRGFGLAGFLVEKCEECAQSFGYKTVRADTNLENAGMQSILVKLGYSFIGEIPEFGQMMKVYEKTIG